jgi:hypothetical protein
MKFLIRTKRIIEQEALIPAVSSEKAKEIVNAFRTPPPIGTIWDTFEILSVVEQQESVSAPVTEQK